MKDYIQLISSSVGTRCIPRFFGGIIAAVRSSVDTVLHARHCFSKVLFNKAHVSSLRRENTPCKISVKLSVKSDAACRICIIGHGQFSLDEKMASRY